MEEGVKPIYKKKFGQLLVCSVGHSKTARKTTENRRNMPERRLNTARTCIKRGWGFISATKNRLFSDLACFQNPEMSIFWKQKPLREHPCHREAFGNVPKSN